MARVNYFILLRLSVDPPESDEEKIFKAISKLKKPFKDQAEEIKKIMLDPKLRKEEATNAKKIFTDLNKSIEKSFNRLKENFDPSKDDPAELILELIKEIFDRFEIYGFTLIELEKYLMNNKFIADFINSNVKDDQPSINISADLSTGGIRNFSGGTFLGDKISFLGILKSAKDIIVNAISGNDEEDKFSDVQFSAIAPKEFIKDEYSIVDVVMYEEEYKKVVDKIIEQRGDSKEVDNSENLKVKVGTEIKVILNSPDVEIEDNEEVKIWNKKYLRFEFPVKLPKHSRKKKILFTANIYFDNFPATKLKFIADVKNNSDQLEINQQNINSAFISYASQDRNKVIKIVRGMKKIRPQLDVFFDVDSLHSGEYWAKTLQTEIEKRDIFFLCWSQFAKKSKWVEKEWRYALKHKGLDLIEPVPIESAKNCPPPKELESKHFNDRLLYIEN